MPAVAHTLLLVYALLAAVLCLYLLGAVRPRKPAVRWSLLRSASFVLGLALLTLAATPAIVEWAHADLRGHMAQHLLLGMFAPLALVLGAPGMLLLRTLPTADARRVVRLLDTTPVRCLIHPVTALSLNLGGMYMLYATPLYAASRTHAGLHAFVHLHFVVAGYLFTWSIAGPDPAPRRPGFRTRLFVLFAAMAAHSILAKLMYAHGWPRGGAHSMSEAQAAAQWMYYGGDAAELLLATALFATFTSRRPSGAPARSPRVF